MPSPNNWCYPKTMVQILLPSFTGIAKIVQHLEANSSKFKSYRRHCQLLTSCISQHTTHNVYGNSLIWSYLPAKVMSFVKHKRILVSRESK